MTRTPDSTELDARAKRIFDDVLELEPPARKEELRRRCGSDSELRERIERWLALDEADTATRDDPVGAIVQHAAQALGGAPSSLVPGQRVGRYEVVGPIASGGMGDVFEARQHEPMERRVALKVIRPGLGSPEVLRRFESERQVLSLMNHSSIATVLDAGALEDGRPYFVMEFVDGLPIDRHCDDGRLSVNQRLHLFLRVCDGVQHAHRKGVVHRDLKPSNVLVTQEEQGDTSAAVPKIIDFGIAKALDPSRDDLPETVLGSTLGTPEYMSPEQAGLHRDIDTRTDIYSLGVLLYELLSGTRPLTRETLRSANLEQAKKAVRETPAERLGTRIRALTKVTSAQDLDALLEARDTSLEALQKAVRGDLEWICARALAKEPDDRYGSVDELANDIRRHLSNLPILAGPPTAGYRLTKFVQRNRFAVVAAGLVMAALLIGVIGLGVGLVRAREAQQAAEIEAERTQAAANFLASMFYEFDANEMGEAIVARVADAGTDLPPDQRAAVDLALQQINRPDLARAIVAEQVLERAAARLETDFADDPQVRTRLLINLSNAVERLGLFSPAIDYAQQAVDLGRRELGDRDPDTVDSISYLGDLLTMTGRYAEAQTAYEEVLEAARERYPEDHEEVLIALRDLGIVYTAQQDRVRAYRVQRAARPGFVDLFGETSSDSFSLMMSLAINAHALHRYDESLELARKLTADDAEHTGMETAKMFLVRVLESLGEFEEARAVNEGILRSVPDVWGEEDPRTQIARLRFAGLLATLGEHERIQSEMPAVAERLRASVGANNPAAIIAQLPLARSFAVTGDFAAADALLTPALTMFEPLPTPKPPVTWQVYAVAAERAWLAGDLEEAIQRAENLLQWLGARPLPEDDAELRAIAEHAAAMNRVPHLQILGISLLERGEPGDTERAADVLDEALSHAETGYGADHFVTATLRVQALDASIRRDPSAAGPDTAPAFDQALETLQRVFGARNPALCDPRLRAGAFALRRDQRERARDLLRGACTDVAPPVALVSRPSFDAVREASWFVGPAEAVD